ncbi:lysylphosphatidylglycerol synthase transmembrane domain-containing protein [Marinobacter sp. CHS3-4]|uniref:lysylphosphatidylglycerol synthase transmembrane domain-containing protein n=1 Tax=Marinobacter sp. CHS3-4 TaxID=3045174 RepID=UPI0024B578E7|nr:lysylphosphatidylglycerol synthase transmembrane domain-containing protein [Marinobacter sp. CHS3-4]MDI9244567.1 lysylphosphatidylglycerol synthase transmembrane domain-containing protein [Marinobacter sp. CHS3-4]
MTAPDSDQDDYRKRASGKRLALFALIFVAMTAAGLYAVYDQFAGRSVSFDDRLLDPAVLLAIVGLLLVYFCADGLRLYFTLRALDHKVPLRVMARLVFINLFFSNVTPMATGGGFAQVWYLHNHGVPLGRATAATTIRTILAVIFIFSLTPVFLLTLDAFKGESLGGNLGPVLAVLILLYLGFFLIVLFRTRWLIGPLARLLRLFRRLHLLSDARHRRWQFKARREMLRFSVSFGDYLKGPRLYVGLSILFTFVFLMSLFSFPALLIWALDYQFDYLISVGLLVVTTFIMYFSPTPGASGISEGVFGSFFSDILTANHLILVTVAWRFITIYLGMLIGLVLLQRELLGNRKESQ